jgi:hypothetical protein
MDGRGKVKLIDAKRKQNLEKIIVKRTRKWHWLWLDRPEVVEKTLPAGGPLQEVVHLKEREMNKYIDFIWRILQHQVHVAFGNASIGLNLPFPWASASPPSAPVASGTGYRTSEEFIWFSIVIFIKEICQEDFLEYKGFLCPFGIILSGSFAHWIPKETDACLCRHLLFISPILCLQQPTMAFYSNCRLPASKTAGQSGSFVSQSAVVPNPAWLTGMATVGIRILALASIHSAAVGPPAHAKKRAKSGRLIGAIWHLAGGWMVGSMAAGGNPVPAFLIDECRDQNGDVTGKRETNLINN